MKAKNDLLRNLPKVDDCLSALNKFLPKAVPLSLLKIIVKKVIDLERQDILLGKDSSDKTMDEWCHVFKKHIDNKISLNLKRVVNGTGVVVHTNFGRSILSNRVMDSVLRAGSGYSNLEFDINTGKRGSRYSLVEDVICDVTGAEAALIVNNNAAAVLISLESLAKGKEVVVSRGQLVEIGGSFRIPDVMKKSGATLVEVGATNRTHLKDYVNALTDETALLLKVHTSNFRVVGFTSEVSAEDLVRLAHKSNVKVMDDLGSGCLVDLSHFGLPKEPTVQEAISSGVDIVTFSGDKLLGGPQAGIIVGKKEIIDEIKANPLNRALRIDKFTLAALEVVFREYYDLNSALKEIPTLNMLTQSVDIIKDRACKLLTLLEPVISNVCDVRLVSTSSFVGGGAMPEYNMPSWAIEFNPKSLNVSKFERKLRINDIPVVGRIEKDLFLLDMRTILDRQLKTVAEIITNSFK